MADTIIVSVVRITVAREVQRANTSISREAKGRKILRVVISVGVAAVSVLGTAALGFLFSQSHCSGNRTAPSWEATYYRWAPSPVSSEDFDAC